MNNNKNVSKVFYVFYSARFLLCATAAMTSRRCNRKDDVINCRVMPKLKTSPNLERKKDRLQLQLTICTQDRRIR